MVCETERYMSEVEVCAHRVSYRWDFPCEGMDAETKERLDEEAEERAKHCIIEGYITGELCAVVPVGSEYEEVHGWWSIAWGKE